MSLPFDDSMWQSIQQTTEWVTDYQNAISTVVDSMRLRLDILSTLPLLVSSDAARRVEEMQAYLDTLFPFFTEEHEPTTREVLEQPEIDLIRPDTHERIITCSPTITLLEQLRTSRMSIHDLHWRQLEAVIAELLQQNGYQVIPGPGSKDGGKDIIATKYLADVGFFMAIWQTKKLQPGNKVGVSIIRELADTRQEQKASKGIIVTTTSLTRGALTRIEQDRYLLGKVDGEDLQRWIQTGRTHTP